MRTHVLPAGGFHDVSMVAGEEVNGGCDRNEGLEIAWMVIDRHGLQIIPSSYPARWAI